MFSPSSCPARGIHDAEYENFRRGDTALHVSVTQDMSLADQPASVAQTHPHNQRPQGSLVDEKHDFHDDPKALVISPFGKLADKCSRRSEGDMDFAEGEHIPKCYGERDPADGYDEVERRHRGWFRGVRKLSNARVRGLSVSPATRSNTPFLYKLRRTASTPPPTIPGTIVIAVNIAIILLSHECPAKLPGLRWRGRFSAASVQRQCVNCAYIRPLKVAMMLSSAYKWGPKATGSGMEG
ncbi:hypothetical protein V499_09202 [Pseudogymnoascus sp. VKM F-103]|nr:hypothetical protein V499_09202 [Pseudogymnoascus sp. VKM F-103]